MEIQIEMAYGPLHDKVVEFLEKNSFIADCLKMTDHLFVSETLATQEMKRDISDFLESYGDVTMEVVANFLIATKDGVIANAVIPLLNNVEVATVFSKASRFAQYAKVLLSVLCCRNYVENAFVDGHWWFKSTIIQWPELAKEYKLPSLRPLQERVIYDRVTGNVMTKVENLETDKCLEILGYLANVKLTYSRNWLDKPEMLIEEDATEEEKVAYSQYTALLAKPITATVNTMAYFYNDLIVDYRLRVYSRLDSVNFTANKQVRSMLQVYEKEDVKIEEIKVDKSIQVKLPKLPADIIPF